MTARGCDADTLALLAMPLAVLRQEKRGKVFVLVLILFAIVVGESPPLERRDLDGRTVPRGPETGSAKGDAVYEVLAVGRDLVAAAETALLSVFGDEGSDAATG